jgi:hypothetical protein
LPHRGKLAWTILPCLLALATAWAQVRAQAPGAQGAQEAQQAEPAPAPATHGHNMPDMEDMPGMNMGTPSGSGRGINSQQQAQAEAMRAMEPGHTMDMAHMRLTPLRPANAADRQRADQIVAQLREMIEPYKDYRVALANGYQIFLPQMPQGEYHFNNYWNSFVESFTFDPTRPSSLLYKKTRDGWELTGAMYTAPRSATLEQLDERVPLSVARWHEHVNLCMPRRTTANANWKIFGLNGSITTAEACSQAGGRYYPQIFGWMVHIYPFAAPDKMFAH